jgi:protein AFG1
MRALLRSGLRTRRRIDPMSKPRLPAPRILLSPCSVSVRLPQGLGGEGGRSHVVRNASLSTLAQPALLLDHWRNEVLENRLCADPAQERAAKKLHRLQIALEGYDNGPLIEAYEKQREARRAEAEMLKRKEEALDDSSTDALSSQLEESEAPPPYRIRVPRGLYLYGGVGTGKSLLMDSFFDLSAVEHKRRYHFHAFLAEVHKRIHQLKQEDLQRFGRNFSVDTNEYHNPIHRVGRQIAGEISLLCFDEFQVTDVADAVILSQLFSVLFALGTVVVATSNRPPTDLYEGGLNRSYFLPFIDYLGRHCMVHDMASTVDYRKVTSANFESFFFTAGPDDTDGPRTVSPEQLDVLVEEIRNGAESATRVLSLGHRRSLRLTDADTAGRLVRLSFTELCDHELGASDYRKLAQHFQMVVIKDIPLFDTEAHNRARRFITLIDELYEAKCALICVASDASAREPSFLFPRAIKSAASDDEEETGGSLGIDQATTQGGLAVGALASVRELAFAFERAASRLTEMTSRAWWDRVLD